MANRALHARRIVVGRPDSRFPVALAVLAGVLIGLAATFLLKFMGR